jgi:hypothetical protein
MGVDDMVTELELDVFDLASDFEILDQLFVFTYLCRNGFLLRCADQMAGP